MTPEEIADSIYQEWKQSATARPAGGRQTLYTSKASLMLSIIEKHVSAAIQEAENRASRRENAENCKV